MKLLLKFLKSSELWITVPDESTVNDLKSEVDQKLNYSPAKQLFFFKGKRLQDDKTLDSYGIATDSTLKLVIKSDTIADISTNNITNQTTSLTNNHAKETDDAFKSEGNLTMQNIEGHLPSVNHSNSNLYSELLSFLEKHYHPKDLVRILNQFNKNFEDFIMGLTLRDIDEVAKVNIARNQ